MNASTHDERTRQHAGHRHTRTGSSGSAAGFSGLPPGDSTLESLWPSGTMASREGRPPLPPAASHEGGSAEAEDAAEAARRRHYLSLAQVAQEVCSRMVHTSKAVAKAPVKAVVAAGSGLAAAGTSVRQASVTGARALQSRVARPKSAAGIDGGSGSERAPGSRPETPTALAGPDADVVVALAPGTALARVRQQHRKTMSLDTGTAAAAQQAAAAALCAQQNQQRGGAGGPEPEAVHNGVHGISPQKQLLRRPSNLAEMQAAASMQRAESRVRGPSRLACFTICGRRPAVKE